VNRALGGDVYELLRTLARRPGPFSVTTIRELWTKPHLAAQMLEHHLSQESEHSSRPIPVIENTVEWIDRQLDLAGKRVIDLGCGPGLYARRMAQRGARVTGVDFSASSIDYALSRDTNNVEYLVADYLEDELPSGFDIAVLIFCDYCAMSPASRKRLLGRVRDLLEPGGHFVLDLNGPGAFDAVDDHLEIRERLMGGFFAPGDYVGIHKTDVYEDEWLSLDRFVVIEPTETWQLFNWAQYYSPESAAAELAEGGFMVAAMTGGLDGAPFEPDSRVIGVIAGKAED
jgi:SAM-dependent methyltransferase